MNEEYFASASKLLTHLEDDKNFEMKVPIDVEQIATELGISIEEDFSFNTLDDVVGEIFFRNENPVVRINPFQNSYLPRKRFTLAHEIGHYCLHSMKSKQKFVDSMDTMSRTKSYWNTRESEANNFAAQLLMPRDLIIAEGQECINSLKQNDEKVERSLFIEKMADKFQVSNKAMEYRLRNIGIIK